MCERKTRLQSIEVLTFVKVPKEQKMQKRKFNKNRQNCLELKNKM
jgi:hypothetical protein